MVQSRHLVFAWALAVSLVAFSNIYGIIASHILYPEFSSLEATTRVNKVLKPRYHFQPEKNWINDPNGPMHYNGVYHLFYQYNPNKPVWGYIVWGHSVSEDLINWLTLEPAIKPSKSFDIKGAWSGSATVLPGNKPVILYTGVDRRGIQVQNIAWPANLSDPYLHKWVKPDSLNPLIFPSSDINASCFRDPTTAWWNNKHWKIAVGGKRKHRGIAYLYRSKDFIKWTKAKHPLHSTPNTGNWECVDFYPVSKHGRNGLDVSAVNVGEDVKYVLKVSLDETRYDYYTIGRYDPVKDIYVPSSTSLDGWDGLRYDYGNFYASKSFYDDKKKRRVLWGWSNESDSTANDVAKGWAGIQTIPRSIWLDTNGKQLMQWPVEELEALRGHRVHLNTRILKAGHHVEIEGVTAAQADIEVTFSLESLEKAEPFNPKWVNAQDLCDHMGSTVTGGIGPFGILALASQNLEEYTPVFFRVFRAAQHNKHVVLMCSDAKSSSLNSRAYKPSFGGFVNVEVAVDKKISLRSLIDHSVVESYGAGGKTVITSRVYPALAVTQHAHLIIFNNGTETLNIERATAWSLKTPKMNYYD